MLKASTMLDKPFVRPKIMPANLADRSCTHQSSKLSLRVYKPADLRVHISAATMTSMHADSLVSASKSHNTNVLAAE